MKASYKMSKPKEEESYTIKTSGIDMTVIGQETSQMATGAKSGYIQI